MGSLCLPRSSSAACSRTRPKRQLGRRCRSCETSRVSMSAVDVGLAVQAAWCSTCTSPRRPAGRGNPAAAVELKILTGDAVAVACKVCCELGMPVRSTITGEHAGAATITDEHIHAACMQHACVLSIQSVMGTPAELAGAKQCICDPEFQSIPRCAGIA